MGIIVRLQDHGMGTGGDDDDLSSSAHDATIGNGAESRERERHEQFVAALDDVTIESLVELGTMDQLATQLGWTRSEVELHAYRYMAALTELSEEEYGMAQSRERRQTDYLTRANRNRGQSPGFWNPTETRLLQTLLASFGALEGDDHVNVVNRVARFFPTHTTKQVEHQIKYLQQRRRLAESMED